MANPPSKDTYPLCKSKKGYTLSTIIIEYRNENNMKIHSLLHDNIENVWQNKLKSCSNLFNASKFRLHHIEFCSETEFDPKLKLCIGLTCYKDFIGTNCAPYAQKLCKDGLKDYSNPQAYMADPIGVGALLITSDNDLILMRRSNSCAEMTNLIDRPGGHPEPDVLLSGTTEKIESIPGSIIAQEIFNSVLKEIRDEINIPLEYLSSPILLGIGYNPDTWRRPSLEFYVRCNLQTRKVQELYQKQTQAECDESTELIVVPVEEIITTIQMDLYREFTHPLKCAIEFLRIFLK